MGGWSVTRNGGRHRTPATPPPAVSPFRGERLPRQRAGRRSEVQTGAWLPTAAGRRDWLHARRYAPALQSSSPVPVINGLPMRLAAHENATLRTIATYGRRYPAHPTAQWGDRHSASVVGTTDRLLVNHRLRGWISFWFTDLAGVHASLDDTP